MATTSKRLAEMLPELVLLVKRDGVLIEHLGGRAVADLDPIPAVGKRLDLVWPAEVAAAIIQLMRRAIASRSVTDTDLRSQGVALQVRATPQGPDQAICVIRPASSDQSDDDGASKLRALRLDRRGFLARFKDSLSSAALRETSMAVAIIQVEGIDELSRLVDTKISAQLFDEALGRLATGMDDPASGGPSWFIGPLREGTLALAIESADRSSIEGCVMRACASLSLPLRLGDATVQLMPHAGAAILGQDADSARMLLDHASTAAAEARRSGSARLCFFSDTLQLRSLARLDIIQELRDAIAKRDIRLRYAGRYDLATGRRIADVGYLRWCHPVRGEIRPSDLLRVAEVSGLAKAMSRSILQGLQEDFSAMSAVNAKARLSFGALRHHLLHADFVTDIARLIAERSVPAEQLELRISERTLIAADISIMHSLRELGVDLVVDEIGRGFGSLGRLAQAGLSGMQLDRSWTMALRHDPVALKVTRAALNVAQALEITSIAIGVDDEAQRKALLDLGCCHGMGQLFESMPDSMQSRTAA